MTTEQYRDVVALETLQDGVISSFTVDGTPMILIRDGDHVHALGGKCPHKQAPMDQGAFCKGADGHGVVVCPWHKAVFNVAGGALEEPVALDPLPSYPVEIVDGRVRVSSVPTPLPDVTPRQKEESVLVLGGGAAAVSAAVTLRERGFAGSITLLGEETTAPYDRTALSKTVIVSDPGKAHAPPLREKGFYDTHAITRLVGRIVSFDPTAREAVLEDGARVRGDHVVIATGAVPRRIDIPGAELDRVLALHRESDAEAIAALLRPEDTVVIIGGGFVGLEAASALRQRGVGVTIILRGDVPMEKQFGREIGRRLFELHEENGVAFVTDSGVARIYGEGRAAGVELEDGMRLPAALVLVSIGARPATDYVQGLERDGQGAVVVDHAMRAGAGVYAVGDASAIRHEGAPHRIEHWRHAQVQGRIAALAIMGEERGEIPMPWFWTQQFGKKIEHLGWGRRFETVEIEGDLKSFSFLATYRRADGRAVGLAGAGHAYDMALAAVDFDGFLDGRG